MHTHIQFDHQMNLFKITILNYDKQTKNHGLQKSNKCKNDTMKTQKNSFFYWF